MARIVNQVEVDNEEELREERFLLLAQTQIQKLLNEKGLRYKDLSARLGVSEARVSQMFGDEAANLTIRSIARIFSKLGEVPVLLSMRELQASNAEFSSSGGDEKKAWQVSGGDSELFTVLEADIIDELEDGSAYRASSLREWIQAEPLMVRQA